MRAVAILHSFSFVQSSNSSGRKMICFQVIIPKQIFCSFPAPSLLYRMEALSFSESYETFNCMPLIPGTVRRFIHGSTANLKGNRFLNYWIFLFFFGKAKCILNSPWHHVQGCCFLPICNLGLNFSWNRWLQSCDHSFSQFKQILYCVH